MQKLHDIHQDFYNDLTKAVGPAELNPMSITVADCFIMNKEKFLIYGEFCSNLVAAQERLDQMCLNPEVQKRVTVSLKSRSLSSRYEELAACLVFFLQSFYGRNICINSQSASLCERSWFFIEFSDLSS